MNMHIMFTYLQLHVLKTYEYAYHVYLFTNVLCIQKHMNMHIMFTYLQLHVLKNILICMSYLLIYKCLY